MYVIRTIVDGQGATLKVQPISGGTLFAYCQLPWLFSTTTVRKLRMTSSCYFIKRWKTNYLNWYCQKPRHLMSGCKFTERNWQMGQLGPGCIQLTPWTRELNVLLNGFFLV